MSGGRIEIWPFLRHRREARQHLLEVGRVELDGRPRRVLARHDAAVDVELALQHGRKLVVEIGGGVCECGEDEQFPVALVERGIHLRGDDLLQAFQLRVVRGVDGFDLGEDVLECRDVCLEVALVRFHVEVFHVDGMLADGERGDFVLIVHSLRLFAATTEVDAAAGFQHAEKRLVLCEYAGERFAEGVNGAFKALQHVDDHEVLERVLASLLVDRAAAPRVRRREVVVVLLAAGQNVHRRRIDAERARDERVVEFLDLDCVRIGGDRALLALRGKMGGKLPDS